jgi:hypothetical protein
MGPGSFIRRSLFWWSSWEMLIVSFRGKMRKDFNFIIGQGFLRKVVCSPGCCQCWGNHSVSRSWTGPDFRCPADFGSRNNPTFVSIGLLSGDRSILYVNILRAFAAQYCCQMYSHFSVRTWFPHLNLRSSEDLNTKATSVAPCKHWL